MEVIRGLFTSGPQQSAAFSCRPSLQFHTLLLLAKRCLNVHSMMYIVSEFARELQCTQCARTSNSRIL